MDKKFSINERTSEALFAELNEATLKVLIEDFPDYSVPTFLPALDRPSINILAFTIELSDNCISLNPHLFFSVKRELDPTSFEPRKYLCVLVKVFSKSIRVASSFYENSDQMLAMNLSFKLDIDDDEASKGWNCFVILRYPENGFPVSFKTSKLKNNPDETILEVVCTQKNHSNN